MRFFPSAVFGIALFVVAPAALAQGEKAPSAEVQKDARRAFDKGARLFDKKEYALALAEFQRAFELVPHDAVRFNIAVCLERLGRHREAVEEYEQAAKSTTLGEKDLARARAAADVARRSLGRILVKGATGVAVKVDGTVRCESPCTVDLDPGTYRVQLGDTARVVELAIVAGREHVLLAESEKRVAETPMPPPQVERKPAKPPPRELEARGPGFLTWTGGALAIVGGAGTVYFGLQTRKLHDDYTTAPTQDRLDDGRRSKLFTNVSIGVAAVGATLVVVDLVFFAPTKTEKTARARRGVFEF
jgi:hypothetical protein